MADVIISYDYRCPFAKNMHLHLLAAQRAGLSHRLSFAPWTMSQGHRASGAPDVWDDPSKLSDHLALYVSASVRDLQPEYFAAVHEALFRGRHEKFVRLVTEEEIRSVLVGTGVDLNAVFADVASGRCAEVIRDTYREFEGYEAFGVPTFVINGDATFIRYMEPPVDDSASAELINSLITLMTTGAAINEFKHTRVPA